MIFARDLIQDLSDYPVDVSFVPSISPRHIRIIDPAGAMGRAPKATIEVLYQYHSRSRRSRVKRKNQAIPEPSKRARYIAKLGERHYPVESITEHLFTRLGQVLGLNMAHTSLVRVSGQVLLLSKVFIEPRKQSLVHGAQIIAGYLEDEDFVDHLVNAEKKEARNVIFLEDIRQALQHVYPKWHDHMFLDLQKILLFDAWTGCQDRHLYNWGVVESLRSAAPPRLAPAYDNARGLFWREFDRALEGSYFGSNSETKYKKYIDKSAPEIGHANSSDTKHFDLAGEILSDQNARIFSWARQTFTAEALSFCLKMVESEFSGLLREKRIQAIRRVLEARHKELYHYLR